MCCAVSQVQQAQEVRMHEDREGMLHQLETCAGDAESMHRELVRVRAALGSSEAESQILRARVRELQTAAGAYRL